MVKIFVTGATGYIGGDGLYAIVKAHPEYEVTCLARNSDRGALIAAQYPRIKLAYGELDSHDILVEEACKADIVLHFADCDHEPSARALIQGLSSRPTPSYLIHTSGTGILTITDVLSNRFAQPSDKIYDDWTNVSEVTSLPPTAWHRNVDTIVLAAHAGSPGGRVHTAIVCPPTIYGPGRGPGSGRGDQVYKLAEAVLKRGKGFVVGAGENRWPDVHVWDLSEVYLKLTEAAAAEVAAVGSVGGEGAGAEGKPGLWDAEGYYFAENHEFVWGDVQRAVAAEARRQGFIGGGGGGDGDGKRQDLLDTLTMEEADALTEAGGKKWGLNSRCRAVRARELLGWRPKQGSLLEEIPAIVEAEAKRLGLVKGHAARAAGE